MERKIFVVSAVKKKAKLSENSHYSQVLKLNSKFYFIFQRVTSRYPSRYKSTATNIL